MQEISQRSEKNDFMKYRHSGHAYVTTNEDLSLILKQLNHKTSLLGECGEDTIQGYAFGRKSLFNFYGLNAIHCSCSTLPLLSPFPLSKKGIGTNYLNLCIDFVLFTAFHRRERGRNDTVVMVES